MVAEVWWDFVGCSDLADVFFSCFVFFSFQTPSLLLEPASKEEKGRGLLDIFFFFSLSVLCSPCPFLGAAGGVRKSHGGACRLQYVLGALSAAPHLLLKAVSQMAEPLLPRAQPLEHLNRAPCHCVCKQRGGKRHKV